MGAREISRGEETTQTLLDEGLDVAFIQLDVTNPLMIEVAAQEIENQFGKLDILINNAGIIGG